MYKKIMVPLDGSKLAECVLPHVESIVKGCGNPEVVFVRVVEPKDLPAPEGVGSDGGGTYSIKDVDKLRERLLLQNKTDAEKYLSQLTSRLGYEGAIIKTQVLVGHVAGSLAEYVEKQGVDLIVIATHGRSGISRWVWGSTTDRILRSTCVPVFMVRAPGCFPGV
jgi:nucleotide-binding universal stress UspA family protein